ncbi:protein of unknown function [Burkholderia multivorans]
MQLAQAACFRPAVRRLEQVGARALAAVACGDLHIADMQRVALLGDAQHADAFAVGFEDEVLRFAPARIEQVASPDEAVALVIAAHVAVRERFGKRKIAGLCRTKLKDKSEIGRVEHRAAIVDACRHDSAARHGCNRDLHASAGLAYIPQAADARARHPSEFRRKPRRRLLRSAATCPQASTHDRKQKCPHKAGI